MNIEKKRSSLVKALNKIDNKQLLLKIEKLIHKEVPKKLKFKKKKQKAAAHVVDLSALLKRR